jgi:replicative DNA helicase
VAQMPHGQTVMGLAAEIRAYSRLRVPDLVVIDYLALMSSSDRRYSSSREELSAIVKAAQHFAIDFNKGSGVATMSPWQLNRESQKEMVRTGVLDTTGLAETAEAVNSAHLVAALSPDTRDGRSAGLKLSILKQRDGNTIVGDDHIPLQVDYASSYFKQRIGGGAVDDPFALDAGPGVSLELLPSGF